MDNLFDQNNHPEILSEENWLSNIYILDKNKFSYMSEFRDRLRFGNIAYDTNGEIINNYIPVFLKNI